MDFDKRLCILCRGGRNLCGKAYCPILTRLHTLERVAYVRNSVELFGTSPPAIFVGRLGYPRVYVGPMAPIERGDTSIYDFPEQWSSLKIDDVIEMRLGLILGRTRVEISDIDSRIAQALHELVLSTRPTDVEMVFEKPPKGFTFSEYEPPIGPRAPLSDLRIVGSTSSNRIVERFYSDTDAKATTAVVELYRYGVAISYIQKLLSVGALGRKRSRKFVPTRWSITAVDDAVSRYLVERHIKRYKEIDRVQLFIRSIHKNLFASILIPGRWCFEWMEAWFPRSTWNMFGSDVVIEGDHELFTANRDTYASIGGCYYAARLATAEYLERIGRQATSVVLREIYPGFDIPIGVWFVREQLRAMYREKSVIYSDSLEDVLRIVDRFSSVGIRKWIEKSYILKKLIKEKRLDGYLAKKD